LETGDKRQELVMIGQFANNNNKEHDEQERIKEVLDECLLNDEEWELYKTGNLESFEDPWEPWGGGEDEEEEDGFVCELGKNVDDDDDKEEEEEEKESTDTKDQQEQDETTTEQPPKKKKKV
jgi:hypothetical protein